MREEILELLEEKKYPQIAALVKEINPADAAALLEDLPEQSMPILFRLLPKELAADAFAYMDGDAQEILVRGFSDKELDEVMGEMFLDDTVDLIEEMPANVVKRILRHVDEDTRKMINQVLNYPKDSAGSIMTMQYVDLKRSMTVEQAFDHIRSTGVDSETVYTCYVTDSRRKLEGIVTVRELLLAPKTELLRNIMETNVKFVSTHTDQEEAARLLSKYDFLALPVVDAEERLVGIVTVDDAMDVIQEEATEDMERMLKESSTAVLCGATLAVANFAKLMLLDHVGIPVALVVCLTIMAVAVVANMLGSLLPMLAKRIGLDPTVMASPLISTILDAVSLIIFFNIAVAVLGI